MVCEQFYNTLTTEKFWDGQFPKGTVEAYLADYRPRTRRHAQDDGRV